MGEPEDVVDEQQYVFVLDVAEVLGHRERRERDTQPHARRLVHLPEHEGGLLDHAGFGHLEEQVVALAGPLPHAGEDRNAALLLGLAADHLLDDHRLPHAGAAEHPDLAALDVGLQEVDHLDPGLEHDLLRLEIGEGRSLTVDRPALRRMDVRGVRVQGFPEDVVDVPEHPFADGHGDRGTGVDHRRASDEAIGRLERDRANL